MIRDFLQVVGMVMVVLAVVLFLVAGVGGLVLMHRAKASTPDEK